MKRKRNEYHQQIKSTKRIDKRILSASVVSFMLIVAAMPLVFALSEDTLVISFDPDSDIDIDVSLATYNYSTVTVNEWTNTSGEHFTLYNNGTISMDTEIRADNITAEGNMSLNESGVVPGTDEYALYIEDLSSPGYVNDSYIMEFDDDLLPASDKSFDICLLIGTNTTLNHTWQTTTIYFRGSIHS